MGLTMIERWFKKLYKRTCCEHYWEVLGGTKCYMCPKCGKLKYTTYNEERRKRSKVLRDNVLNTMEEKMTRVLGASNVPYKIKRGVVTLDLGEFDIRVYFKLKERVIVLLGDLMLPIMTEPEATGEILSLYRAYKRERGDIND